MTVLVLGSSGQLATHLKQLLPDAAFRGRESLDLARAADVAPAIRALQPTLIVNAAAYTAVDKAESEPELAWRINAEGVAAVARSARELDVPLIHISTDYVFDGLKDGDYDELDPVNPISVYGSTKLAGELSVRTLCRKAWIFRVSWLFSEHGTNFVKTMLRLAAKQEELRVVADQRGRPTYAGDLAGLLAELAERSDTLPFGTYNASGGPVTTWHSFAGEIVKRAHASGLLARAPLVRPIATEDFPTAAKRPRNSALKPNSVLETTFTTCVNWQKGLDRVLERIAAGGRGDSARRT